MDAPIIENRAAICGVKGELNTPSLYPLPQGAEGGHAPRLMWMKVNGCGYIGMNVDAGHRKREFSSTYSHVHPHSCTFIHIKNFLKLQEATSGDSNQLSKANS